VSSSEGTGTDDLVQPFQIEDLGIRGRVVRLGPLVDRVLTAHAYPEPVSRLLGEALALTALIGSALKFDGRFILQTQGNGPVSMLVADYQAPGKLRGYAMMNSERLAEAIGAGRIEPADLMGEGHLALTIDQGAGMEPYQGIVALLPGGLSHSAHEYFANSEQVATRIRLAAGPFYHREATGPEKNWRAGAIMIQHIARDGGLTGYREDRDEVPIRTKKKHGTARRSCSTRWRITNSSIPRSSRTGCSIACFTRTGCAPTILCRLNFPAAARASA
jgi:molecular chaperone Hsp33